MSESRSPLTKQDATEWLHPGPIPTGQQSPFGAPIPDDDELLHPGASITTSITELSDSCNSFMLVCDRIRGGPIVEFEASLVRLQKLWAIILSTTSSRAECEAVAGVVHETRRASKAVADVTRALQSLCGQTIYLEGPEEDAHFSFEAQFKRQLVRDLAAELRAAVSGHIQGQQKFQQQVVAKAKRQLRLALPNASEAAISEITAEGFAGMGAALQVTVFSQSCGITGDPMLNLTLKVARSRCDQLEKLARAAAQLQRVFDKVEVFLNLKEELTNENVTAISASCFGSSPQELDGAVEQKHKLQRKSLLMFMSCLVVICIFGMMLAWWLWETPEPEERATEPEDVPMQMLDDHSHEVV